MSLLRRRRKEPEKDNEVEEIVSEVRQRAQEMHRLSAELKGLTVRLERATERR